MDMDRVSCRLREGAELLVCVCVCVYATHLDETHAASRAQTSSASTTFWRTRT